MPNADPDQVDRMESVVRGQASAAPRDEPLAFVLQGGYWLVTYDAFGNFWPLVAAAADEDELCQRVAHAWSENTGRFFPWQTDANEWQAQWETLWVKPSGRPVQWSRDATRHLEDDLLDMAARLGVLLERHDVDGSFPDADECTHWARSFAEKSDEAHVGINGLLPITTSLVPLFLMAQDNVFLGHRCDPRSVMLDTMRSAVAQLWDAVQRHQVTTAAWGLHEALERSPRTCAVVDAATASSVIGVFAANSVRQENPLPVVQGFYDEMDKMSTLLSSAAAEAGGAIVVSDQAALEDAVESLRQGALLALQQGELTRFMHFASDLDYSGSPWRRKEGANWVLVPDGRQKRFPSLHLMYSADEDQMHIVMCLLPPTTTDLCETWTDGSAALHWQKRVAEYAADCTIQPTTNQVVQCPDCDEQHVVVAQSHKFECGCGHRYLAESNPTAQDIHVMQATFGAHEDIIRAAFDLTEPFLSWSRDHEHALP